MAHNFTSTKVSNKAGTVEDGRLPGRPSPRFIWAHHPDSWEFMDGQWLPRLKKIPLIDGVNGCKKGPNGHIPVLNALRQDRWVPLDEDGTIKVTDPATGQVIEDKGYLCAWDGQKGTHYSDAWGTPLLIGAGRQLKVDWSTEYDHQGFDAWRRWLVDSGTIEPPSPAVEARVIKTQANRAKRRIKEGHDGNPHVQAHVVAEHEKLEAMKATAAHKNTRRRVKGRGKKAKL